jgi:hypothetical protein
MLPQIEELTDDDRRALESECELGRRICRFYLDDDRFDLPAVDQVFDLWLRDRREKKPSPNEVAMGLGCLIGEHLRNEYQCRWVIISDGRSVELGMLHEPSSYQLFPRHWVAKRLDPANAGSRCFQTMVETLQSNGVLKH